LSLCVNPQSQRCDRNALLALYVLAGVTIKSFKAISPMATKYLYLAVPAKSENRGQRRRSGQNAMRSASDNQRFRWCPESKRTVWSFPVHKPMLSDPVSKLHSAFHHL